MFRVRTVLLTLGIGALVCTPLAGGTALASDARQQAYADAAAEFGVPEDLLLAVSYAETRWDTHDGEPSRGAGYGPMHLTDLQAAAPGHQEDRRGDSERPDRPRAATMQTVDRAAELLATAPAELRTDPRQNIRGGAALLAEYQRRIDAEASEDPADWYGAVARYSGSTDRASAAWYADEVYEVLAEGADRRTDDGHTLSLPGTAVQPDRSVLAELGLRAPKRGEAECPRSLPCEWLPAPYEEFDDGADYGNHDKADRPDSQRIRYIVIHDTEGDFETVLDLVQDPTYVSWQYSMRNSDGHIAQHVKWKDVAWHAGNWYVNSKSIGIEHEGYAGRGTWYSEVMYRKSAELVRYIARENDIPIDRHHIVGHDNVPGITPEHIPGMHWDPGPYWDWDRYFQLLGKPIHPTGTRFSGMVTIKPDFDSNNPGFQGCEDQPGPPDETEAPTCGQWGSSAVVLRDAPSHDADLLKDIGTNPPDGESSMHVSDIGSRASTGQQFAVAEIRGDWTAIWFHGQKGWFHNPRGDRNAVWSTGLVVKPKPGKGSVPVYGRAYPEPDAYPDGVPVQEIVELGYEVGPSQRYVLGQRPESEYLWATTFDPSSHEVVRGDQRYYQIQVGHRFGYVKADDVRVVPSWKMFD